MTTEKEQLEAEIAQRDARIAELEAQAGEGTSSNKYRAELYDEVWQAARDMGYGNVTGALQELAALKAQKPGGVVLPTVEQITEALDDVTCFHDLSAELIAPALLENLRAMIGSTPAGSGVVLPERANVCYGTALDTQLAEAYNDALDEVARLNPCRAQDVPDGYVLVPVEPTTAMILAYNVHGTEAGDPLRSGPPRNLNVGAYKDMIAAPFAKKELSDE